MATFNQLLFALTLFAALGCGLVGGVFFAFSTFVMKALSRLPPWALSPDGGWTRVEH